MQYIPLPLWERSDFRAAKLRERTGEGYKITSITLIFHVSYQKQEYSILFHINLIN